MKKSLKDKWVKALRSGNYKQGVGGLCNKAGEYCCLGVLVEESEGPDVWAPQAGDDVALYFDGHAGVPSHLFFEKIGGIGGALSSLVQMNDEGIDFDVIATYIENDDAI